MTRRAVSIIDIVSTYTSTTCSGKPTSGQGAQLGGMAYLGYIKDGVKMSDGFMPTNYWCKFQNTANTGVCQWRQINEICAPYSSSPYATYRDWTSPFGSSGNPFYAFNGQDKFLSDTSPPRLSVVGNAIRAECTNQMLAKLKQEKMQLFVSLGESKQTLGLVNDLAKTISGTILHIAKGVANPLSLIPKFHEAIGRYGFGKRKLKTKDKQLRKFYGGMYDAFRRQRPGMPTRLPKVGADAAQNWLAYRYGVLPLMADLDAANQILINDVLFFEYNGIMSQRYIYKYNGTAARPGDYSGNVTHTSKLEGIAQAKVYYSIANHTNNDLKRLSMSLRDVPATVYELIPFSFVFDWFLDLGSYFAALGASYGLTFKTAFFSVIERGSGKARLDGNYTTAIGGRIISSRDAQYEYGMFYREVYTSFPLPYLPSFTLPFRGSLDPRIADTVGLLFQAFGKSKPKLR